MLFSCLITVLGFVELNSIDLLLRLKWPNTVFAHALADAIQHHTSTSIAQKQIWHQCSDHFICSMSVLSVLVFFPDEHNVLMVLLFYYKGMLEKVTMQRTQQFSAFVVTDRTQSNAPHAY